MGNHHFGEYVGNCCTGGCDAYCRLYENGKLFFSFYAERSFLSRIKTWPCMLHCFVFKFVCLTMCGNIRERAFRYFTELQCDPPPFEWPTIPTNARDMGFHITGPACTRSSYIPPEPMDHTAMDLKMVKRSLEIFWVATFFFFLSKLFIRVIWLANLLKYIFLCREYGTLCQVYSE